MLRDGDGVIHMILGDRTALPEIHGMWQSTWLGQGWSDLEPIVSGPRSATFDPSAPKAVVSQGNVILAAWRNDVRDAGPAVYSYIVLNVTESPMIPFPTPTPIPTVTPSPTENILESTPVSTLKPMLESPNPQQGAQTTENSMLPIIVAVIPVLMISMAVIVIHRVRR
jgi:hypothetical protein